MVDITKVVKETTTNNNEVNTMVAEEVAVTIAATSEAEVEEEGLAERCRCRRMYPASYMFWIICASTPHGKAEYALGKIFCCICNDPFASK